MTTDNINIKVDAEAGGAVKGFGQARDALGRFTKGVGDADSKLKKFKETADSVGEGGGGGGGGGRGFLSWLGKTAIAVNQFMSLTGRVTQAIEKIYKVAEEGARNATAEKFFVNAGKSLEDYRKATQGLVSDADLIKKSNLADTMGIQGEAFKNLAVVAHAAAAKTGQSYSHMLDSIILGTARESRLLLDNLGIIVNVTKAREDYVQKLREHNQLGDKATETNKKLAASLTDEAEKLAFIEAALKAGGPMLEEYAKTGENAAEKFDLFSTAVDNLADQIGRTLVNAFQDAVYWAGMLMNAMADTLRAKNGMADLRANSKAANDIAAAYEATSLQDAIDNLGPQAGVDAYWRRKDMAAQGYDFNATSKEEATFQAGLKDAGEQLRALTAAGVKFNDAVAAPASELWRFEESTRDAIVAFQKLNKALDNPFKARKDGSSGSPFKVAEGPSGKSSSEKAPPLPDFDFLRAMRQQVADIKWERTAKSVNSFAEANETATATLFTSEEQRKEYWDNSMKELADAQKRDRQFVDTGVSEILNIAGSAVQGDAAGAIGGLSTAIGAAMGFPQIGAAIGSILGPLLASLKGVGELFNGIMKGAQQLISLALGPLLDTLIPLGPALQFLLGSLGQLIGSILRPFVPIVEFIIALVAGVVDVIGGIVLGISPFVEMLANLISGVLLGGAQPLFSLVEAGLHIIGIEIPTMAESIRMFSSNVTSFASGVAQAMIDFNNSIVTFIRGLGDKAKETFGTDGGLSTFGKYLKIEDFFPTDAVTENTDATEDNTKAVRDLSRELRNLPAGYRINNAFYQSEDPRNVMGSNLMANYRNFRLNPNAALRNRF